MQHPISQNDVNLFSNIEENQFFDRKSARIKPNDAAKHVVAFANASGGKLVIGIEDDGEVTGFDYDRAQNVEDYEQLHLTSCTPGPSVRAERISVVTPSGREDFILVIDVEPSPDRVICRRNDRKVFLR